jgi:hypothetical protein
MALVSPRVVLVLALAAAGCGRATDAAPAPGTVDASGALLPDTQTVNGAMQLVHRASALAAIPELWLDTAPIVVYDDLSGTWDMSKISIWHRFSDGRMVGSSIFGNPGLMLFAADGRPERLLARYGEGPGDIGRLAWSQLFMVRDTLLVIDPSNQRLSRFTAGGFLGDEPLNLRYTDECAVPIGYFLTMDRWLTYCRPPGVGIDNESTRPLRALGVGVPGNARVVHVYPGLERRRVLGETTAGMQMIWETLVLGRNAQATVWNDVIVLAVQDRGYVLEVRDTSGVLQREIVLERPLLPVTQAMRDTIVALQVAAAARYNNEGGYSEGELERRAREQPFPDSLPPHGPLVLGTDGVLWVFEPFTEADSTWSAIGFRADGAIVGQLSGRGGKFHRPFWFGQDTALMREEDENGLVRFAMYRVARVEE